SAFRELHLMQFPSRAYACAALGEIWKHDLRVRSQRKCQHLSPRIDSEGRAGGSLVAALHWQIGNVSIRAHWAAGSDLRVDDQPGHTTHVLNVHLQRLRAGSG